MIHLAMDLVHLDLSRQVLVVHKLIRLHLERHRNHQNRHRHIHMNPVHKTMNLIMVQLLLIVTLDMGEGIQHYRQLWRRKREEYLAEREK